MTSPLMDLYTVVGIAVTGAGIIAAEELISFLIRRAAKRARAGRTVLRDLGAGMRLIALLIILSNILSVSGLSSLFTTLTVSGVMAVAASLALQSTLSNVISGLLLFNDGVLRLGDSIAYSGTQGTVVRIGLRNTWIKTDEGHLAVVSNSSLSSGPLANLTATDRLSKKYAFLMEGSTHSGLNWYVGRARSDTSTKMLATLSRVARRSTITPVDVPFMLIKPFESSPTLSLIAATSV